MTSEMTSTAVVYCPPLGRDYNRRHMEKDCNTTMEPSILLHHVTYPDVEATFGPVLRAAGEGGLGFRATAAEPLA